MGVKSREWGVGNGEQGREASAPAARFFGYFSRKIKISVSRHISRLFKPLFAATIGHRRKGRGGKNDGHSL
jgi:hypothetical protein